MRNNKQVREYKVTYRHGKGDIGYSIRCLNPICWANIRVRFPRPDLYVHRNAFLSHVDQTSDRPGITLGN
jgi:hypothetical protein